MKNAHRNILFISTMIIFNTLTYGQGRGFEDKRELIKSEKIAFLTNEMELLPEEAQVFWPVYNDFQNRVDRLNDEKRTQNRYYMQNQGNLSAKELEELGDRLIAIEQEEAQLKADLHDKLKNILPPGKIVKLYHAEMKFKNYLLRQLRGGHGKGSHPRN